MKFIDEVKIEVRSGKGGNGCVSFRREKYIPRGGPNGGDGGKGGGVILEASGALQNLLNLSYRKLFRAKNGQPGLGKGKHGKDAPDLIIPVPLGTIVRDDPTKEILADLIIDQARYVAARGGRGGRGNARFTTSTIQAPRIYEKGKEGEERILKLELKLLAQVGIIGFPNAGKSTLISKISAARPEIDDYPFTTLTPNLGVIELKNYRTIIAADIPGIIEGAHRGAGLGDRFLRHVERTNLLIHILDISNPDIDSLKNYYSLNEELELFNPKLIDRPQIIVINKVDLPHARLKLPEIKKHFDRLNLNIYPISSLTGEGIEDLMNEVERKVFSDENKKGQINNYFR